MELARSARCQVGSTDRRVGARAVIGLEAFLLADNDEDARAQPQRALLHNAPKAPPREPTPGERLMKFGWQR